MILNQPLKLKIKPSFYWKPVAQEKLSKCIKYMLEKWNLSFYEYKISIVQLSRALISSPRRLKFLTPQKVTRNF